MYFHGNHRKKSYFEGWYLKHQCGNETVAFIPAFHIDKEGNQSASLQIITKDTAHRVNFPIMDFYAEEERFKVKIGKSWFSEHGAHLHIKDRHISVYGDLFYGPLDPPEEDIMGPFRFLPHMQCVHGILSRYHTVRGSLRINGATICFQSGWGYIETDRGSSFPSEYVWTQCNHFKKEKKCAVMVSSANIPVGKAHFTGCICDIFYQGQEYRLATYHGARPALEGRSLRLNQGPYSLLVQPLQEAPQALASPVSGTMSGTIHESASCVVRYVFSKGEETVFDLTSPHAGFEWVQKTQA